MKYDVIFNTGVHVHTFKFIMDMILAKHMIWFYTKQKYEIIHQYKDSMDIWKNIT